MLAVELNEARDLEWLAYNRASINGNYYLFDNLLLLIASICTSRVYFLWKGIYLVVNSLAVCTISYICCSCILPAHYCTFHVCRGQ